MVGQELNLCALLRKGEQQAFELLYNKLYKDIYSFAVYYLSDCFVAEDIVHDSFVYIWENRAMLKDDFNVKNYLLKTVKNKCLNYINHNQVVDRFNKEFLREDLENNDETLFDARLANLERLLQQLPDKRREVLELHCLHAKSYSEIAEKLDISLNTVKDHLKKAYAFLRENMKTELSVPMLLFLLLKK